MVLGCWHWVAAMGQERESLGKGGLVDKSGLS